jgi:hypothetical protein
METSQSIVEFIKNKYPKVIFKPVKFAYSNALGFVVSGDKLIIGFINKLGSLCKLAEPIDLSDITNDSISAALAKIPIVNGFTEKDRERLYRLFQRSEDTITRKEHNALVREIENKLKAADDKESEYRVMFDSESNKAIAIQSEYNDKLAKITQQYEAQIQQYEEAKTKLVNERDMIKQELQKYQSHMKEFVRSKDLKIEDLEKIQQQMTQERDLLQQRIAEIIQAEEAKQKELAANQEMLSNYTETMGQREQELTKLKSALAEINQQLESLKESLKQSELEKQVLAGYKTRCQSKLMDEKQEIIKQIKSYNDRWMEWSKTVATNFEEHKRKLIADLQKINKSLEFMLQQKQELEKREQTKLKQNIKDIQTELQKTISEQLIKLNEKDEQIKMLESAGVGFMVKGNGGSTSDCENASHELQERDKHIQQTETEIVKLKLELEEVRALLVQNNRTKVESTIDYDNCYNVIQNFFALNNIFFRKQEIINRLDNIIASGIGNFTNLAESTRENIKKRFEVLKIGISNHIQFLDLERYINSDDFRYLKSKATRNKVSPTFCSDLNNILDYWNQNKAEYREQDRQLTNIYEDLSGAVRVYIRIKPLIGLEQKEKTVSVAVVNSQKQKRVVFNCENVPEIKHNIRKEFGEFYGVFDESFTNDEVYTGVEGFKVDFKTYKIDIEDIIENSETVSPGLYSTFQQVEDGYSIVIFGYGASGSGKSYTLLGSKATPGLVHYGLSNLRNVKNIRLKYLFEQYFGAVDLNFAKVRGKIHNLIREIPQMREYAKDERNDFGQNIPEDLNLENIRVPDLYRLTGIIEKYRLERGRIKKTPNNPESSRSHLYFVFEIDFDTGKTGYVTIVDTAGRESPLEIYDTFIDSSKMKLSTLMAPPPVGGEGAVEKGRRSDLDPVYTSKHIYEVLKEGFYINETINHLIYFFNKKNYRQTKIMLQPSDPTKYTVSKYFVSPIKEEQAINNANNCLMIPIMRFLDTLSNRNKSETDYKPTKFIMMCMIRQEERYCDQIFETLDFAQNVKSS